MVTRRNRWVTLAVLGGSLLAGATTWADVRLPHVFGSHMVLQRDTALPVWGWADAGEKVTVQLGTGEARTAEANAAGQWRLNLPPAAAGGPLTLTVKGQNTVTLEDVLVGEVWLCSGQSNMEMVVRSCINPEQEAAAAQYPRIRHLAVPKRPAGQTTTDFDAQWQVCSPETVGNFTACGYFMARELLKQLDVPVGLINASWGGTLIEPWVPPVGFGAVPELKSQFDRVTLTDPRSDLYKKTLADYLAAADAWTQKGRAALAAGTVLEPMPAYPAGLQPFTGHQDLSTLYNGMVHPLVPFAVRGAIWYQGESNHREGGLYTHKMKALVGGWRQLWGQPDLAFNYVQIAPWNYGGEDPYILPEFWAAQAAAMAIPNTGMVVTNDVADLVDIHPKNKQEVGRRLALIALRNSYGKNVVCYGPTFKEMVVAGNQARLSFDNVGAGLASRDGQPLTWFEVIGEDTDFVKATATLDGNTVVVSAPEVAKPVAVRFAWHRDAEPNFANRDGLPASPFVAGTIPDRDPLRLKIAEAKDYQLVYTLDLAKLAREVQCDADQRARVNGPFDRIAYFLELQKPGEQVKYVYASMDAFTTDLGKIGLPVLAAQARFQQKVTAMNVVSNVEGVAIGGNLKGGCIEFWSHNYAPANAAGFPNASGELWDFGDQSCDPVDGHGCMQLGNTEARQTVFAINNWKAGPKADLGIGNSEGRTRDWTFMANADTYSLKRLRVLVRPAK